MTVHLGAQLPPLASRTEEPLRVLHVHSGNLYGGVETTLMAQVRHRSLCLAMETSFALCFAGQFSEEVSLDGVPIHWLGDVRVRQPLSIRRARQNLKALLERERYDVIVTHSAWSQSIFGPVLRSSGLPLVFWLHGTAQGHWLERWAGRTVPDLVICNSHFTASTLADIFPYARAEVVYPPMSLPESSVTEAEGERIREELDTPKDAVVIIQVSRMESWKGHALHLEALSLLKDLPGWICWQVGGAQRPKEARYLEELKMLAAKLEIADRIRFLGQRSDVSQLLAASDIHCQPNTSPEPFGLTFVEALAAQLPVITTAIGGAKEIINDSCGVLVPPHDAQTLSASLRLLIENKELRLRLGASGAERARELCNVETQLQQIHNCLVQVC